jgi:hypothetical protein
MKTPTSKPKRCADCRNGEHENYDDEVQLVVVRDSEAGRIVKRANLCEEHREMYISDGYRIYV